MSSKAFAYIEAHRERFLEELQAFLRFPSVSAQAAHDKDIQSCAAWLKEHLAGLGLESRIIETSGRPIVRADSNGASDKRIIIYGHYDVQPEDPRDQWRSEPFEPTIREGKIFARGATDDKGQLFAHIKAVESLLKTEGTLPCEVTFLVEGEEECGGHGLADYLRREKAALSADAVVISDNSMYDERTPAITYGLRGLVSLEVTVYGPRSDVHSGTYGGAVANPAMVLAQMLAGCVDGQGKVTIPGFYDDVAELSEWEKANLAKLAMDEKVYCAELGIGRTFGEAGYSTLARSWARPTLEINGIWGGYTGQGAKTIIPAQAQCKITMRMVPNQNPHKIGKLLAEHLRKICPATVRLEIVGPASEGRPVIVDVNEPVMRVAAEALKAGFGAKPVFIRAGGSIPVAEAFAVELGKPVLLMGFGLDSDGAHSPNEHFGIDRFVNGAKTSAYLMKHI